ncbi:MAG: IclR family transcriptional regulator [Bacillota bacterium]|nr:IclR family transcriptional regulator [Bacillota bacterium]MDD3299041.1 IclR family transcriptional regulator [Bacillota bacterium]MDD3851725.1 IclR family transcriptional regulator [Bacillota bacterium]MDD4708353.1 IclR family transcriptional regulator [Bacillota bacterium]
MKKRVQTLDRALDILETLAEEGRRMGVTELGQRVGLHKSTVYRLLSTLLEWGYVEKDSKESTYKLGLKIIDLGSIFLNNIELKTEALPYLNELKEKSQQPVHLARLEDGQIVYMEKVDVISSIRMYSDIGRRVPAHSTALGKAMMAHMNVAEVEEIISTRKLRAVTPKTITDKQKFMEELRKVKAKGYALDDQENEMGIRCLAAPIMDYRCKVIAAVSTSGAMELFTYERLEGLKQHVMDTAHNISIRLGFKSSG